MPADGFRAHGRCSQKAEDGFCGRIRFNFGAKNGKNDGQQKKVPELEEPLNSQISRVNSDSVGTVERFMDVPHGEAVVFVVDQRAVDGE